MNIYLSSSRPKTAIVDVSNTSKGDTVIRQYEVISQYITNENTDNAGT